AGPKEHILGFRRTRLLLSARAPVGWAISRRSGRSIIGRFHPQWRLIRRLISRSVTMLWALLLSLSMAASAVTGIVKDSNGGVIPGATITVRTPAGAEQQVAVTNADGRFSIEVAAPDNATLIVHLDGFADKRVPVSTSGDMEIVLQPASIFETVV